MKGIWILIISFSSHLLYSQEYKPDSLSLSKIEQLKKDTSLNLVPNYSFEEFVKCPPHNSIIPKSYFVDDWIMATKGTPDYFNYCSSEAGIPNNWTGSLYPRTGNGYVGEIAGMFVNDDGHIEETREYIEATLKQRLEKDKYYFLCFSTSLGQKSRYAINGIGMYLSDTIVNTKDLLGHLPFKPQLIATGNPIIKTMNHWIDIYGIYKARGTEKYVILGNFQSDEETKYKENDINSKLNCSYYLFDDIFIIPLDFKPEADSSFRENKEQPKIRKMSLLFDFNRHSLKDEYIPFLQALISEIKDKSFEYIEINGYADNVGSEDYNKRLSTDRAWSVADFIIRQNIPQKKVIYRGFGENNPVSDNGTERGRLLNRRVEIVVHF